MRNGLVSHWWAQAGPSPQRPEAPVGLSADVVIVGGGFTGLWTAYYLAANQPNLDIAVLEQRTVGYGASGRNGGWLTNGISGGRARYEAEHGRDVAQAFQLALTESVDEIIAVAETEHVDADIVKGGQLSVARNRAQAERLRANCESALRWSGTDVELLTAAQTRERIDVSGARLGAWHPHCARINPVKLVTGLAAAVERRGVRIFENTRVSDIGNGFVTTGAGTVRAGLVVQTTEGFTSRLPGQRRVLLPMNSSMIVTEPLSSELWADIGWAGQETLGDAAHAYMYAQRTADDRIALGGRGKPYRFGSRVDLDGQTPPETVRELTAVLNAFFPATTGARIDHAWSGVLGVPRDWRATVGLDRLRRIAGAGGYVGTGVTATNLAGRTLADLISGADTELARLPWVGHRSRKWEPEPLRWLGVHAMYAAYRYADRAESSSGRGTSPVAKVADRVSGFAH